MSIQSPELVDAGPSSLSERRTVEGNKSRQNKYINKGYVPGHATDPDKQAKQEDFQLNQLEPRLQEAQAGQRVVLFMDAAHFVYGVFLGMVWCFTRLFLPSPSGRKRFNVLGAINAVTKEVLTVTHESYINASSVCQLLSGIAQRYGKDLPITIVLDNARYQKCELILTHAASLASNYCFYPPIRLT